MNLFRFFPSILLILDFPIFCLTFVAHPFVVFLLLLSFPFFPFHSAVDAHFSYTPGSCDGMIKISVNANKREIILPFLPFFLFFLYFMILFFFLILFFFRSFTCSTFYLYLLCFPISLFSFCYSFHFFYTCIFFCLFALLISYLLSYLLFIICPSVTFFFFGLLLFFLFFSPGFSKSRFLFVHFRVVRWTFS